MNLESFIPGLILGLGAGITLGVLANYRKIAKPIVERLDKQMEFSIEARHQTQQHILQGLLEVQKQSQEQHLQHLQSLHDFLHRQLQLMQETQQTSIQQQSQSLQNAFETLTQQLNERCREIAGQVEQRLNEGFEKSTATFADIVKRLALIDEAQKKITELSGNVVSLQEVLANKSARGAFGEVQLSSLITDILPAQHYELQFTLSNQKRVDCLLRLPEPHGNIAIDAKFPLESYQRIKHAANELELREAEQQFRRDIRKHIQDISEKYIIPGETADGAILFLPAESVFAEIHSNYADLVAIAQRARVWIASPTTMMAILTTAKAVIKDAATRQQVHVIQEHLIKLAQDFQRFQSRMNALESHIAQAHEDAKLVNISARKITGRFEKIEQVRLEEKTIELEEI